MKRLPEIDALCDAGCICAFCGEKYFPNRKLASSLLKRPAAARYCSHRCGALASQRQASAIGNEVIFTKRTGVPRDPDSGLGKAEHHIMAKSYCVEAPDRKRYVFRNIRHFVREHENLFDPADVVRGKTHPWVCRADRGLGSLFRATEQRETWKGWRGVWKKDRLGAIEWER